MHPQNNEPVSHCLEQCFGLAGTYTRVMDCYGPISAGPVSHLFNKSYRPAVRDLRCCATTKAHVLISLSPRFCCQQYASVGHDVTGVTQMKSRSKPHFRTLSALVMRPPGITGKGFKTVTQMLSDPGLSPSVVCEIFQQCRKRFGMCRDIARRQTLLDTTGSNLP